MNLRGWVVLAAVVLVVGAVMWRPPGPTVQVPTGVGRVRTQGRLRLLMEVYGVPRSWGGRSAGGGSWLRRERS
nr:hypothetical protein [bacterium]